MTTFIAYELTNCSSDTLRNASPRKRSCSSCIATSAQLERYSEGEKVVNGRRGTGTSSARSELETKVPGVLTEQFLCFPGFDGTAVG